MEKGFTKIDKLSTIDEFLDSKIKNIIDLLAVKQVQNYELQ
jgi:hypothetical protein